MSERSAMNQALYYLGRSSRTTSQVREYLQKKEHSEDVIESVLSRIVEYGYLNDADYAESFIRQSAAKGGRRKLQSALMQKGVDRETAEEAVAAISDDDELTSAMAWITKWERQLCGCAPREKRDKIYRRLASRGYSWDVIQRAVNADFGGDFDDCEPCD